VTAATVAYATIEELLEAVLTDQQNQSVQAPNADSSSLSDMFKVVATVLRHVVTELNVAEPKGDGILAIIKTHEAKWLLKFIGPLKL
jgi:hypothetical protein